MNELRLSNDGKSLVLSGTKGLSKQERRDLTYRPPNSVSDVLQGNWMNFYLDTTYQDERLKGWICGWYMGQKAYKESLIFDKYLKPLANWKKYGPFWYHRIFKQPPSKRDENFHQTIQDLGLTYLFRAT